MSGVFSVYLQCTQHLSPHKPCFPPLPHRLLHIPPPSLLRECEDLGSPTECVEYTRRACDYDSAAFVCKPAGTPTPCNAISAALCADFAHCALDAATQLCHDMCGGDRVVCVCVCVRALCVHELHLKRFSVPLLYIAQTHTLTQSRSPSFPYPLSPSSLLLCMQQRHCSV